MQYPSVKLGLSRTFAFYDTRTFSPRAFINRGEGWNFWECFITRDPGLAYKNRPLSLSLSVGCVPLPRGVIALPWSDLCKYCAQEEQSLREWTPISRFPYQDTQHFSDKRKVNFSRILFLFPPPIFCIYSFFPDNDPRIDKIIRFLEDKIERFEESIKIYFLTMRKWRESENFVRKEETLRAKSLQNIYMCKAWLIVRTYPMCFETM